MIGIPLKYSLRNLFVRRVTNGLTLLGIGLVVTVGLLSGMVPAILSIRRPITDGLRQVA